VLTLPESRMMKIVGKGVSELRVSGIDKIYRTFYSLEMREKIMVFHMFVKKDQKTPQREIDIGKRRLKEFLEALDE